MGMVSDTSKDKNDKSKVNICKYWIKDEPEQCSYWDSSNKKCTYKLSDEQDTYPDKHPHCNLIGTCDICNKYKGSKKKARCVLPDQSRGGLNIQTGKYWSIYKNKKWDFSAITGYGDKGFCDSTKEIAVSDKEERPIGKGNGLSVLCTGYNPGNMVFGPYLPDAEPLDFYIYNNRAQCSRCFWWKGSVVQLKAKKNIVIDEETGDKTTSYSVEEFETRCKCGDKEEGEEGEEVDEKVVEEIKKYKEGYRDKDTDIMSFPCNGAKSNCPYYTGIVWKYCVEDKLRPGDKILAEQIQELRYYAKKSRWTTDLLNSYFGDISLIAEKKVTKKKEEKDYYGIHAWDGPEKQVITISEDDIISYDISVTKVSLESGRSEEGHIGSAVVGIDESDSSSSKNKEFLSFKIKYETVHITKDKDVEADNKTKKDEIEYPTLIKSQSLPFGPVILNKFDKDDNKNSGNGNYVFETTEITHEFIDIIGECKFYRSMPIAINLSILEADVFPKELLEYECKIEIEKDLGPKKYAKFLKKLVSFIELYSYYKSNERFTSTVYDKGGLFIIPTKTQWGENDIFVFDKGSGEWEYDKISVKKIFYGAVIAQTSFSTKILDSGKTIDYLPFYKSSFCGEENKSCNTIDFELMSFGHKNVEIKHVYNDYVIQNEYDGKKYEAGYELYKTTIVENIKLEFDDGEIIPIGTGGVLLLLLNDNTCVTKLHRIYSDWIINDEEDISKVKLTVVVEKENKDGKIEEKTFEVKIFKSGTSGLLSNQILVEPADKKFCGVGPGAYIEIESIKIYEKRSFAEKPDDTNEKIDYKRTGSDEKFKQNDVFYNNNMEIEIKGNRGIIKDFSDQIMLISVVYKSKVTNRILGVIRTKMITWVRQPTCRDVQILYTWNAEYEEFDLVPMQYFRFDQIGFLEKPAQDSNIQVVQTLGYGDFMGYPYTFFPSKAIYPMDPDVLQASELFYPPVVEYYRKEVPGEIEISYIKKGRHELVKVIEQKEPINLELKAESIKHGYYDMRRLCPAQNNVTIWLKTFAGGYITFCLSNTLPANLEMLGPPNFDGSAMILSGISAGLYGNYQQELGMGIGEGKSIPFNVEQCAGRFGGGTREVMESYRSIDNLCYGKAGDIVKMEAFKDLIAVEKLKNGGESKIEIKKKNENIKEYQFRQWLPVFDSFSEWGLTTNLLDSVFENYTFDLESPYYHPFSVFLIKSVDGIDMDEKIQEDEESKEGEENTVSYKRYDFNSVFEPHRFEFDFYGFKYAVGTMYPNLAVPITVSGTTTSGTTTSGNGTDNLYGKPNAVWLTFKNGEEEGEGEEEEEEKKSNIQWAWREQTPPVYRKKIIEYVTEQKLKDLYKKFKNDINTEPILNPPFVESNNNNKGIFVFFKYSTPEYLYDDWFKEYKIMCDEGDHVINLLTTEEATKVGIIFVQLNNGPPRGLDKDGNWDPEEMSELIESVGEKSPNELYMLYTTCTKDPWVPIVLFDTDYNSTDEQEAKDDGRYFQINGKDVFYQIGLNLEVDFGDKKWLPSKESLIESSEYSVLFTEIPNDEYTKSSFASVETDEWYPNSAYCYNVVYFPKETNNFSLKFKFESDDSIFLTKVVFIFKHGLKTGENEEVIGENGKKITKKHIYLYNIPTIEIVTNELFIFDKNRNMDLAIIKEGKDVEDKTIVFKQFKNLLDPDESINNITVNFRIKPTDEELDILELAKEGEEDDSTKVDTRKYIIHFVTQLECVYFYESKLVSASEEIKVTERKFLVSKGECGDFYPDKFEISSIEEAYLKFNDNNERIISLNQVDNFDGMTGYPNSEKECTSMSKCRGRFMGKIQEEEMKAFEGGDIKSYEEEQVKIFNEAVNKGDTSFIMESVVPPTMESHLKKMELEFPKWKCKFENDLVQKLTPLLDVDLILPDGYYFDWGLDNIVNRNCFANLLNWGVGCPGKTSPGSITNFTTPCFDGYKLKSYYDKGAVIGTITDEIFATNSYRADMVSVQERERTSRDSGDGLTGWNANRLAGGVSVSTQEDIRRSQSVVIQQEHRKEREDMLKTQEEALEKLNSDFEEKLEDDSDKYITELENIGNIAGYPDKKEKRDEVVDSYFDDKKDKMLEHYKVLEDLKKDQRDEYYELLTTQAREAENSPANTDKITRLVKGGENNLRDKELTFLKNQDKEKDDLEKSQNIELVEFNTENNKKIDKETNIIERQNLLVTYKEAEESFEEDQLDELEQFDEDQVAEREEFYEDFYKTELIKTIYNDLYGDFLTVDEGEENLKTTDINAEIQSTEEELEEYGKGDLFELQREAFYLLNKEKLTKSILPHPILAYYMPELSDSSDSSDDSGDSSDSSDSGDSSDSSDSGDSSDSSDDSSDSDTGYDAYMKRQEQYQNTKPLWFWW